VVTDDVPGGYILDKTNAGVRVVCGERVEAGRSALHGELRRQRALASHAELLSTELDSNECNERANSPISDGHSPSIP
jgi:hypothetical protein